MKPTLLDRLYAERERCLAAEEASKTQGIAAYIRATQKLARVEAAIESRTRGE